MSHNPFDLYICYCKQKTENIISHILKNLIFIYTHDKLPNNHNLE